VVLAEQREGFGVDILFAVQRLQRVSNAVGGKRIGIFVKIQ
jgi:hypothetical protein